MSQDVLLTEIARLLEVSVSALTGTTELTGFDNWDSLTRISIIAFVNHHEGILIDNEDFGRATTLNDIFALARVPAKLT